MRQIVLEEPYKFVERQAPAPGREPGMALVRIRSVGICGSDFHAFHGRQPAYTYPRVVGHEISGVVLEIPENDKGIVAGDRCAIEPYIACGHCIPCRLDRYNCCESLRLFGLHVDGGMQPLLNVPPHLLHKSETMTLDELALVETLGVGAHAVKRSKLKDDETALIVGAGPIGMAVTQFAMATGASVRVVEKSELRRNIVKGLGVEVLEEPDDRLYNVVFDATGVAGVMSKSLNLVNPAGRLVFAGVCPDDIPINDPLLHKREITLLATRNSCNQFPRIIRMIEQGRIDTSPWVTHRIALADVPKLFADLQKEPNLVKAVVDITDDNL